MYTITIHQRTHSVNTSTIARSVTCWVLGTANLGLRVARLRTQADFPSIVLAECRVRRLKSRTQHSELSTSHPPLLVESVLIHSESNPIQHRGDYLGTVSSVSQQNHTKYSMRSTEIQESPSNRIHRHVDCCHLLLKHSQTTNSLRICVMNMNSAILSISAAMLWSLIISEAGLATQTERRQDPRNMMTADMNGSVNAPATQVSNTPNPCTVPEKERIRALCGKNSQSGSGERAIVESQYLSAVIITTVTVVLIILIVLAASSLALIALAAWSRRSTHPPLENASINLSSNGQGQRASLWARLPSLSNTVSAGWPRRTWLAGFVRSLWSIWFVWSISFI